MGRLLSVKKANLATASAACESPSTCHEPYKVHEPDSRAETDNSSCRTMCAYLNNRNIEIIALQQFDSRAVTEGGGNCRDAT
jgi:hypothetical protein